MQCRQSQPDLTTQPTVCSRRSRTACYSAPKTVCLPDDDIRAIYDHFGADLDHDKLKRQLALLKYICLNEASVSALVEKLLSFGKGISVLLSEVCQLLRLYRVLLASVATAECGFSAMRRIKTFLHSTMFAERLNSAMVLHVNREAVK